MCPPLIYSVFAKNSNILVSTETGHVWSFNVKEIKKPRFIISAHLAKVIRRFPFNNLVFMRDFI